MTKGIFKSIPTCARGSRLERRRRMSVGKIKNLVSVLGFAAVAHIVSSAPVYAVQAEPQDDYYLPEGTNVLLGYYSFSTSNGYRTDQTGSIANSNLDVQAGYGRYVHFFKIGQIPVDVQIIQPIGGLSAKVGGQRLSSSGFGAGDTILGQVMWPIADPTSGTYLTICSFETLPIGRFDGMKALNLGSNRFSEDLQVGLNKIFLEHFEFDLYLDGIFAKANSYYDGAYQLSTQSATATVQTWLTYLPDTKTTVGIGYMGSFGGNTYLNGAYTGTNARFDQIRVSGSRLLNATTQVQLEINHNFYQPTGFRQTVGVLLRLGKFF